MSWCNIPIHKSAGFCDRVSKFRTFGPLRYIRSGPDIHTRDFWPVRVKFDHYSSSFIRNLFFFRCSVLCLYVFLPPYILIIVFWRFAAMKFIKQCVTASGEYESISRIKLKEMDYNHIWIFFKFNYRYGWKVWYSVLYIKQILFRNRDVVSRYERFHI